MSELELAVGFEEAAEAEWLGLVEKVLAGRDFRRALVTRTRDDIEVEPLYGQREDGARIGVAGGRWTVFQRVDHPDPGVANALARSDVDGGAEGLELVFRGAAGANGFGLAAATADDLATVLDGIDLQTVKLRIDGGARSRPALALALAVFQKLGLSPQSVDLVGPFDPASRLFGSGGLPASPKQLDDWSEDLALYVVDTAWNVAPFVADGRAVHAAGGSEAQELAFCIADAVAHMRAVENGGLPLAAARELVTFALAADADQFATIAKLRAIRLLWARVQQGCGLAPTPGRVHAETAWRMMSRRDPWVNLLRTTVATAAAGIGGADSLTVLPFTAALGLPDGFARRLARNTQLVLIEESRLGKVADPTAGSGYVEALTVRMAEAGWTEFQRIEAEGGIIGSLVSGAFQGRVKAVREARMTDVARRTEPLTGISEFPSLAEQPVRTLPPEADEPGRPDDVAEARPAAGDRLSALLAAVAEGASAFEVAGSAADGGLRAEAVPRHRLAEPFERLRDASDGVREQSGRRPGVFLATIGARAAFAARAGFARNAFEAGGLEALGGEAWPDRDTMIAAFAGSGARIACICGTDAGYGERAAEYADALKDAGAVAVFLAGRPGDHATAWADAGVDDYVFAGCDILSVLKSAYRRLGIDTDDAAGGERR